MKFILTFVALVPLLGPLHAQTVAGDGAAAVAANLEHSAPLPDAPKRILGIVPNFRSVSADVILPPETAKEKFETGSQDSFDYSSFIFVGMLAGISQATDSYPVFRQGSAGYGRYYWHTFADQTDENLWVESFLPAALHEDSRYYTLGQGGFLKRVGYALSRAVVTRNDNGDPTFNAAYVNMFAAAIETMAADMPYQGSEVAAADASIHAAAGISSAYYPGQYRTWTKTGQRWLTSVVLDSATFAAKEFWPDIHHALRHGRE